MELSQNKNCNSCKAGYYHAKKSSWYCELGFNIKTEKYTGIPLEPCYKPLTSDDYNAATKTVLEKRNNQP